MRDSTQGNTQKINSERQPLAARLLAPDRFEYLVSDTRVLIADEIKKKGVTLRASFNVVQKAKPTLVDRAVRELMPAFVHAIEPLYADYCAGDDRDFCGYLIAHDSTVADEILDVADRRAAKVQSQTIRSVYSRLRARAKREITGAMPGIARIIARHAE